MGAAVVAGVDASPFFDFAEHILDPMALAMDCAVFAGNKSVVRPQGLEVFDGSQKDLAPAA